MPALLTKKSITRSLSKKWNSVRGNNNNNAYKTSNNISSVIDTPCTDDQMSDNDEAPIPPLRSSLSIDKEEEGSSYYDGYNYCVRPSPTAHKIESVPEAAVVSDTSSDDSDSSGGEDDAAEKYGYGDAVPDTETKSFPRRLSTRNSIRRRSSICRQKPLSLREDENDDDDENLPFHPERAPRRSSIKGTCPTRARARRRASIATCTNAVSIEEELASGTITPSQVLEIRVPGRRGSIKRRTSITFNEDVNVRNIQAISKVKGAVKQELWFQDVEYTQIKKKTRALIQKVDATGTFDGKKYCTRGLEKYMECPQKRASKKYQGWDSVLMEQEMQRTLHIYDDESISGFYKQTAQENVVEATHRAQLDAQEVAAFYTTTTATSTTESAAVAATRTRRGRRASIA
mmetsp:Transcript_37394/g.43044  ORF Transcript_37394/g.43044 Transcript_37394/m.43044 type:complete len:402 (+) Transcript_37394:113-1318(+)